MDCFPSELLQRVYRWAACDRKSNPLNICSSMEDPGSWLNHFNFFPLSVWHCIFTLWPLIATRFWGVTIRAPEATTVNQTLLLFMIELTLSKLISFGRNRI